MKTKNEHTKLQIKTWLANAVRRAQSPNPREKLKRQRKERAKKTEKRYGL